MFSNIGLILSNKRLACDKYKKKKKKEKKKKKKMKKNSDQEKFLLGLQSNCNSNFSENAVKEYYKNDVGPWFDTFMQKTLYS